MLTSLSTTVVIFHGLMQIKYTFAKRKETRVGLETSVRLIVRVLERDVISET